MHIDATLKLLLKQPERLLEYLLGEAVSVKRFLLTELPEAKSLHVDILLELTNGRLVHIELQAYRDPKFGYRMLSYLMLIQEQLGKVPEQFAVWVGKGPVQIPYGIEQPGLSYSYRVVDLKEVDTASFLESDSLNDNLFGLLGKLPDLWASIVRVLRRVAELHPAERQAALSKLLLVSGMRDWSRELKEEIKRMPIVFDIHENEFLEDIFQEGIEKGIEKGREKGREEGREEGRQEGRDTARRLLLLTLTQIFRNVPEEISQRIDNADIPAIERWTLRLDGADTIEEVFQQEPR